MIAHYEQELICDFAEYYRIYDYRSLPVKLAGILAYGLRDNSRTMMAINNEKYDRQIVIASLIHDRLAIIHNALCGGKEKPTLLTEELFGEKTEKKQRATVFSSPEEFHKAYQNRMKKEEHNNE